MVLLMSTAVDARPSRRSHPETANTKSEEVGDPFLEPVDPNEPAAHLPQVLNRDEMLSLVKKYATEIDEAVSTGESERDKAVRAKDAIKLSCIQDRLANLKIMKRLSDERVAASARNRIRDDELNLRHEFRGVELAHQRVVQLRSELVNCMGESLEVSIVGGDRPVPAMEDPTGAHLPPPPVDRPPPASPYK
jgi:hypothetical protein